MRAAAEDHGPEGLPPRRLAELRGPAPGATLVVVAGVHGNEPAGLEGARRAVRALGRSGAVRAGELVALVGNRTALARGVRYVDADLNRMWASDPLRGGTDGGVEAREARELAEAFREVGERARGPVHVLDLHTTSADGGAFAVVPDRPSDRRFAAGLLVPTVLGLEELVQGTLLREVERRGWTGVVLETGPHPDPASVERAEAGVRVAAAAAGLLPPWGAVRRDVRRAGRRLARSAHGLPATVEVRHRQPLTEADALHLHPGLRNFGPVRAGERLGESRGTPILAPEDGLLLMPLYQAVGSDAFFIARPVTPPWRTALVTALERAGVGGAARWLLSRTEGRPCRR